ncbi:unnamed protein product [Adineta ricciae]|uniref:Uncharacterized protein n=1 Tax=Adineta ricciae TaxID=249248 RepID=A0A816FB79_ADIRI|nr:unnamed protein product [Adineta ricciae]
MDGNEPSLKYIEKIVLEIYDRGHYGFDSCRRTRRLKKFNVTRFNAKEAAYAFLRQYDGESFVKAQRIKVWHNNQELHLCVRDLIYGNKKKMSNSMVEFVYRKGIFSEIKWPVTTAYRTNRVRWAQDQNIPPTTVKSAKLPKIHVNGMYSPINSDEMSENDVRKVPCTACSNLTDDDDDQSLSVNSIEENALQPLCTDCRVGRSVAGLDRLIHERTHSVNNEESHFRTSIYVHVNPIHH